MVSFRGGSSNRLFGGKVIHAEQFYMHPQYDEKTYNFDVSYSQYFIDEGFTEKSFRLLLLEALKNFVETTCA